MSSKRTTEAVLLLATKLGGRMFRVNTGMGWVGKVVQKTRDRIVLANPRPLHAGLVKGGSDTIGWMPLTITPEMVGRTIPVFTAVEVKEDDGLTTEQANFIRVVLEAGGIAGVVHDAAEAQDLFHRALQ